MSLHLWVIDVYWGDLGGFRPSVWLRLPRGWVAVFPGWQRPSLLWLAR